jgi:AraC family transcriptional regulator of adaptative response / DNA-3-methyladenine glycosylase II
MPPSALRRGRKTAVRDDGSLRLTLAYRPPALIMDLPQEARVSIDGHSGVVSVKNSAGDAHLVVDIAESLVPVLMPLIAVLRRVFDLDAEPAVIDAHLAQGGLGPLVARWPGVRVPGSLERLEGAQPDDFPKTDPALLARADQWRPWRAYAAQLLRLASS